MAGTGAGEFGGGFGPVCLRPVFQHDRRVSAVRWSLADLRPTENAVFACGVKITMKHLLVLLILLFSVGLVLANCPPGSTFVPNGNYYCTYGPNGFTCDPQGDCVDDCPDCLDTSCSCTAMAAVKPTATTRVEKRGKGMRVTRLVIHTEKKLSVGGPHYWIIFDPATKAACLVAMPSKAILPANLQAIITRSESAFAEQFLTPAK